LPLIHSSKLCASTPCYGGNFSDTAVVHVVSHSLRRMNSAQDQVGMEII